MFLWSFRKDFRVLLLICVCAQLTGCGATHTAINKRKMDVQTKMSSTVFLDPVTADKKLVFLQIRNTSDKSELDLEKNLNDALMAKGYRVVQDPAGAHYVLQANILQVGRSDLRAVENALDRGFGSALGGGLVGAGIGGLAGGKGHEGGGAIVGGLIGATLATVTDAMIQDVFYSVIADIQVSEHIGKSVVVKEKTKSKLKQGTSGFQEVTATEKIEWKRYQTRVVSTANKVNLQFKEAAPELVKGLTRSIAGMF